MIKLWQFGGILTATYKGCLVISYWSSTKFSAFLSLHFIPLIKTVAFSLLMCTFALGGATIGAITGTIKGQTTETGLLRGFGVGAVAGALTAVQLMESMLNGDRFSKVALMRSLVNGKIFMEWVSPAMLTAYQWQMSSSVEINLGEYSDIFDVNGTTMSMGMSNDSINKLPESDFDFESMRINPCCTSITCAICLLDLKKSDSVRRLTNCKHLYHIHCIDEWLSRQGNCPICRAHVN